MGYTHYWENPDGFTTEEWNGIIEDVNKLLSSLPSYNPVNRDGPLVVDDRNGGPPVVNREEIRFNGGGGVELSHETFHLKSSRVEFDFCKTARKPYDIAVQGVLLIAKHWKPELYVSSDGNRNEWEFARELVEKVLGYSPDLTFLRED